MVYVLFQKLMMLPLKETNIILFLKWKYPGINFWGNKLKFCIIKNYSKQFFEFLQIMPSFCHSVCGVIPKDFLFFYFLKIPMSFGCPLISLIAQCVIKIHFKGVLHPRPVFGLFLHFSQKLQHIGNK